MQVLYPYQAMETLVYALVAAVIAGSVLIVWGSLSDRKRINRGRDGEDEKEVKNRWPGV